MSDETGVGEEPSKSDIMIGSEGALIFVLLGGVPASEGSMTIGDSGVSPPTYIPGILYFVIKAVIRSCFTVQVEWGENRPLPGQFFPLCYY